MQPYARMCRSIWWAFAAAGVIALAAAGTTALQVAPAPFVTGVWQLLSGLVLFAALLRAPGGLARASGGLMRGLPFLGAATGGVILGALGVFLPSSDPRISLLAIGIWSVLAGAGYLAISSLARRFRVPDGGLYVIAWAGIAVGIGVSTLPAWGLGNASLAPAAALAATGAVSIAAALRLRVLPDEAPAALSNREARRRERGQGR
jgi:hypothetical protein